MPGRWCSRPREVFILINELSTLSKALEQAGIVPLKSYRNYIPLPNVSAKAPCIRIWVKGGQVVDFEAIDRELAMQLRKFGSNQASFPGLNLISLYRVTDESEKKLVDSSRNREEAFAFQFLIQLLDDLVGVGFGNAQFLCYFLHSHKACVFHFITPFVWL